MGEDKRSEAADLMRGHFFLVELHGSRMLAGHDSRCGLIVRVLQLLQGGL